MTGSVDRFIYLETLQCTSFVAQNSQPYIMSRDQFTGTEQVKMISLPCLQVGFSSMLPVFDGSTFASSQYIPRHVASCVQLTGCQGALVLFKCARG